VNVITFAFKVTECNGWPKVEILIDDDLYEDRHFTTTNERVNIPVDLIEGDHLLTIEIYGKEPKNTILDSEGNIIDDQLIELTDIYVDDIKLPDWFKNIGVYKFKDLIYPQATIWGCNGVWDWKFSTPLLTWVLDKQIANRELYNPPVTSHSEEMAREVETIERFEVALKKN